MPGTQQSWKEGEAVTTPCGTGLILKVIGRRARIKYSGGEILWAEFADISRAPQDRSVDGQTPMNKTNMPLLEASLTRAVNQALELTDSSEQRVESIGRYLVALTSDQPPPARAPPTAKKQDKVPDAEIRALEKLLETALRVVRAKDKGGSTLHNLGSWLIEHKADLAEQVASSVDEDDGGGAAEGPPRAEEHGPPRVDPGPVGGEDLSEAKARYTTATALRALLTHDAARGGVPVRLMSARWQ